LRATIRIERIPELAYLPFNRRQPNDSQGQNWHRSRSPASGWKRAIAWAAKNGVRYLDIQLDTAANAVTAFDDTRAAAVRAACERHGIHLGLHTLSGVNVAEYSPFVSEAMDQYLRSYVRHLPQARSPVDRGARGVSLHRR